MEPGDTVRRGGARYGYDRRLGGHQMTGTSRRELGVQTYRAVMHADPPTRLSVFVCNGRLDQEFAELWNRGVLTRKERRWLTLTALAGQGALTELRKHLYGALKSGDLVLDELMEGVYHFALYRGFGRAQEFEDVLWEVADELGMEPSGPRDYPSRVWASREERVRTGRFYFCATMVFPPPPPESDAYSGPGIHETVFGEMWSRAGITPRERRLITLGCVASSAVPAPVDTHVQAAMETVDLTFEETQEVMLHLAFYLGWPQASQMNVATQRGHDAIVAKREGNEALARLRAERHN